MPDDGVGPSVVDRAHRARGWEAAEPLQDGGLQALAAAHAPSGTPCSIDEALALDPQPVKQSRSGR
jgi:hypothetical protein